jgi:hypothetical protein
MKKIALGYLQDIGFSQGIIAIFGVFVGISSLQYNIFSNLLLIELKHLNY